MSVVVTKAKLMAIINEEFQKVVAEASVLQPGTPEYEEYMATKSDESEAHEDREETEFPEFDLDAAAAEEDPDALRADTILGGGPGEWQRAKDEMTPPSPRPPQEHENEAVRLLASYVLEPTIGKLPSGAPIRLLVRLLDQKGIGQQAIDILAWELYNKAAAAPTQTMSNPAGKPSLLKRMLAMAIKEDLKAHMRQIVLHEVNQEQLSAIRYFTKEQPYEVESMMVQLVDRYGFDLDEVESLAGQLRRMQSGELEQEPNTPELGQMIKEELEAYLQEVYSDKQRRWACSQANKPAKKRKKSLSKKEADEMCKGPKLKPKKKGKKK